MHFKSLHFHSFIHNEAQVKLAFSREGYLSLMQCFTALSENITISHILPVLKMDSLVVSDR